MQKKSSSNIGNALLLLFGSALIGAMWVHQSGLMVFLEDVDLSPGFYYFLNPYFKIIYGVGLILLLCKELLIKKPIKFKIKTNAIAVVVLMMLLVAQMLGWQYFFVKYATSQ